MSEKRDCEGQPFIHALHTICLSKDKKNKNKILIIINYGDDPGINP